LARGVFRRIVDAVAFRTPFTVVPDQGFPNPPADTDDPRLSHRLVEWNGEPADVVLLGVPFDFGVTLGGGRAGAAQGPAALRRALRRFGTTFDLECGIDFDRLRLADAGDLDVLESDVAGTHSRLTEAALAILRTGSLAVVVGGGNDATFASVEALQRVRGAVAGINVDAHLDVRPVIDGRITSGTPYRRIVEELGIAGGKLIEFGLHAHVNSKKHYEWARSVGVQCWTLARAREHGLAELFASELARIESGVMALFVSIDLDVFAAAYAPGVSAPGTDGLTPAEGRAIAHAAGKSRKVRLFELMECNPLFDQDERTARLAAMLLAAFVSGVAARNPESGDSR
jgi:formimidoylglutamase